MPRGKSSSGMMMYNVRLKKKVHVTGLKGVHITSRTKSGGVRHTYMITGHDSRGDECWSTSSERIIKSMGLSMTTRKK